MKYDSFVKQQWWDLMTNVLETDLSYKFCEMSHSLITQNEEILK